MEVAAIPQVKPQEDTWEGTSSQHMEEVRPMPHLLPAVTQAYNMVSRSRWMLTRYETVCFHLCIASSACHTLLLAASCSTAAAELTARFSCNFVDKHVSKDSVFEIPDIRTYRIYTDFMCNFINAEMTEFRMPFCHVVSFFVPLSDDDLMHGIDE